MIFSRRKQTGAHEVEIEKKITPKANSVFAEAHSAPTKSNQTSVEAYAALDRVKAALTELEEALSHGR